MKLTTTLISTLLILLIKGSIIAQCPTSGTISSDCTSTNLTINNNTLNVNSGVTVTVTGTLTVRGGGIINGTGAIFNLGTLAETNGSTNTINGGTYNVTNFSSGNGGAFTMTGSTVAVSPSNSVSIAGSTININSSTFTGVTNWSTNVNSFSMDGTDITASGSIQFEDATIANGTFSVGTSFSTTNGTNSISGSTITVGTTASIKNTAFTNTDLDVQGLLTIQSGNVSFDNGIINTGIGNAGTNDGAALTMNGGGALTLTNGSQMNIRGAVTNNEWYIDDSDVIVTGDFDNAGSEILEVRNNGTINIQGDFNNSGSGNVSADDGGFVQVDGNYDNSGGGSTDVDGGTFVVGGTYSGGDPSGDTGDCTGGSGGCCGASCGTLPVTLIDFVASANASSIELSWSTGTELNNDYFTIEKSFDGVEFSHLTFVAGSGTTNDVSSYSFIDNTQSSGSYIYYRLSQTDFDGTLEKLKITVVNSSDFKSELKVYPNPIIRGEKINVLGLPTNSHWEIYSLSGESIITGILNADNSINSSGFPSGTYLISFRGNSVNAKRIVIK